MAATLIRKIAEAEYKTNRKNCPHELATGTVIPYIAKMVDLSDLLDDDEKKFSTRGRFF